MDLLEKRSHYITSPPKCWAYGCAAPHLVSSALDPFRFLPRIGCLLVWGKGAQGQFVSFYPGSGPFEKVCPFLFVLKPTIKCTHT